MSVRVLIADDEPLSRERLKHFLELEPGTEIVAECANGPEAVKSIREKSPDVAFLDVMMPGLDGFGVMGALDGVRMPSIVFVTAHHKFAVQAFAANVVDYLLKPYGRDRFQTAFHRARLRVERGLPSGHALPDRRGDLTKTGPPLHRLSVRSGGKIALLKVNEIDWMGAADNYVELHVGGATHMLRTTLAMLTDQLGDRFLRISRSRAINVSRIKEVHSKSHGDFVIVLHDGTRLDGSRNYRQSLRRLLGQAASTG